MLKSIMNPVYQCMRHKGKMLIQDYSSAASTYVVDKSYHPFRRMVDLRRTQANNSVLIQMQSEKSLQSIYDLCSSYGDIKFAGFYSNDGDFKNRPMLLIEYTEQDHISKLMAEVAASDGCYKNMSLPYLYENQVKNINRNNRSNTFSDAQNITHFSSQVVSNTLWSYKANLSEEISSFYDAMKLTEMGWRLRFLACRKVELLLPLFLTPCKVLPFGSSINSFGRYDCDVDMTICLAAENPMLESGDEFFNTKRQINFPLSFQKPDSEDENGPSSKIPNYHNKKHIICILNMLTSSMRVDITTFTNAICIFRARVPIIKCREAATRIQCDITAGNMDGYYMSELLYTFGCYDSRVKPLVFYIRKWAKDTNLTKEMAHGRIISNFALTCLVLFYLMRTTPAILPSLNQLEKLFGKSAAADFTFPSSENHDNLEELFYNFFQFYSTFDYKNYGISLISGEPLKKEYRYPLLIENPIDACLNVAQNLKAENLEAFTSLCTDTSRIIKISSDKLEEQPNIQCRLSHIIRKLGIASSVHPLGIKNMNASYSENKKSEKNIRWGQTKI